MMQLVNPTIASLVVAVTFLVPATPLAVSEDVRTRTGRQSDSPITKAGR